MTHKKRVKKRLFSTMLPLAAVAVLVSVSVCGCKAEPVSTQASSESHLENRTGTQKSFLQSALLESGEMLQSANREFIMWEQFLPM